LALILALCADPFLPRATSAAAVMAHWTPDSAR